jgi:hypothetical protein
VMTWRKRIWSISSLTRRGKRDPPSIPTLLSSSAKRVEGPSLCCQSGPKVNDDQVAGSHFTFTENSGAYKAGNQTYILK